MAQPKEVSPLEGLRRRAERLLSESEDRAPEISSSSPHALKRLVHELRTHQIELELQMEELIEAQASLITLRDEFSDLYDHAPVGYLTVDERGVIARANLAAGRLLGLRRAALVGKHLRRYLRPESDRLMPFLTERFAHIGEVERLELRTVTPAGFKLDLLIEARALSETRSLLSLIDVTERRRERAKSQRYLQLAESMFIGLDPSGRVNLVNRKSIQVLATPQGQINGRDWITDFIPEEHRARARQLFREALAAPPPAEPIGFESEVLTSSGQRIPVSWQLARVVDDRNEVSGVLFTGTDLSEQRRVEADKRDVEACLKATFVATGDAIIIIDGGGRIETANPAAARMFGYSEPELRGRSVTELLAAPFLEAHDAEIEGLLRSDEGGILGGPPREIQALTKQGSMFHAELSACGFDHNGLRRYAGVLRDLTERRAMTGKLIRQEGLAKLGEVAAVIAHEVKNPLAGIIDAASLLGEILPDLSGERRIVTEIRRRAIDLNATVHGLLSYSRPQAAAKTPCPLRLLLESAIAAARYDPSCRALTFDLDCPDIAVPCEVPLLSSAFINFFLNAGQATGGEGRVAVTARAEDAWLLVSVADNGPGIPEDQLRSIFELHFTTKSRGSGLGLPIARRSIELHGGQLEITSPPSGGTLVELRLPL